MIEQYNNNVNNFIEKHSYVKDYFNIYKIATMLLSSLLFLKVLPMIFFVIYMKKEGFFSYDFFTDGILGLNVFSFFTAFAFLLLSIFFVFSAIFIVRYISIIQKVVVDRECSKFKKLLIILWKERKQLFILCVFFVLNCIIVYWFYDSSNNLMKSFFKYFLVMTGLVYTHFSIIKYFNPKIGFYSLLVVFTFLVYISFVQADKTSLIIRYGLSLFSSGDKQVNIKNILDGTIKAHGRLLLLSPRNIYLQDKKENLIIIERTNDILIEIENSKIDKVLSFKEALNNINKHTSNQFLQDSMLFNIEKAFGEVEKITESKYKEIDFPKGVHLVSSNLILNELNEDIDLVWTLIDGEWKYFSNKIDIKKLKYLLLSQEDIEKVNSFFILTNKETKVRLLINSKYQNKAAFSKGWSISGTQEKINARNLQCTDNYKVRAILKLNQDNYSIFIPGKIVSNMQNFDYIYPFEGFMILCTEE